MTSRAYLAIFLASALLMLAAIPVIGNALPDPYGSFIPTNSFVRDEFVRQHAIEETPSPCVAFVGDSRTAFNISGKVVDRWLPGGCRSQNYGFAALDLPQIQGLLSRLPHVDTVVVSVSETLLNRDKPSLEQNIMSFGAPRYLFLGHQRFAHLYSRYFQPYANAPPPPASVWNWSSDEKRWRYSGLETRRVSDHEDYVKETAVPTASNYFAVPGDASELRSLLAWLAGRARRIIVVIPPSEAQFRRVAGSDQEAFWTLTTKAARDSGAVIVDCSRSCVDQASFADSVHLNDQGVTIYSSHLAQLIASQLQTSSSSLQRTID